MCQSFHREISASVLLREEQRERERERGRERQTNRQRQRHRQTDRQTDKLTDRQASITRGKVRRMKKDSGKLSYYNCI